MNSEKRIVAIRNLLSSYGVDGFLITNPTNIRWLSGFTGSYAQLLVTQEQAILATDSRYWIAARKDAPFVKLFKDQRRISDTFELLKSANVTTVGFEADYMTVAHLEKLKKFTALSWVPMSQVVPNARQIKDQQEIAAIQRAAALTDQIMSLVPEMVRSGMTESELAWQLEKAMREDGADGPSFPIIVAFGPNSALPHHSPGQRMLNRDEIVLVDIGAELNGYKSDLTRTFFFGRQNDKFQTIFDLVIAAQMAAIDAIAPATLSTEIYRQAHDVIAAGGYGEQFPHGLGHGIGLEIHEQPWLSLKFDPVALAPGMVMTIEPGIYLEGWGGVRIEDLGVLDENGFNLLSYSPKAPYIPP
ncbi:MAG: aminopeptidase P family protein [Candidatus Promineifilaceae bacterium]|nr:aminopeptidase P family protein [Candidatus Promineifilaceae bacterium]